MLKSFPTQVKELLQGAIDMHVHTAPDVVPRSVNDLELGRQAQAAGMRACVIKSHFACTAERAQLASQQTGFQLFGGLTLNRSVGGLNVQAVKYALAVGAKIVWLPTMDAWRGDTGNAKEEAGTKINVCKEPDDLVGELHPILDQIANNDSILATGHIRFQEARVVVKEAVERGVKRILVTHPLSCLVGYQFDELEDILDLGATMVELAFNCTTQHMPEPIRVEDLYEGMQRVGAERCVMTSDAGQQVNPVPVQQMGIFIQKMLELGVEESEIHLMVRENPARLLGI